MPAALVLLLLSCVELVREKQKGEGQERRGPEPGVQFRFCPVSGRWSLTSLGSGSWSCTPDPLGPKVTVFLQASTSTSLPPFQRTLFQGCLLSAPSWDLCRV